MDIQLPFILVSAVYIGFCLFSSLKDVHASIFLAFITPLCLKYVL